jgi:two-component system KDP operon response regulator KdpE
VIRVLLVEDEEPLRRVLARNLVARGYDVVEVGDAASALRAVAGGGLDVLILDLGLPDLDGEEVIRRVRGSSVVPIVVLSARTGSSEKVRALDLGADDFVTKPFDVDELLARLRSVARRTDTATRPRVVLGAVTVDVAALTVTRHQPDGTTTPVHLTPTEWGLLEALVERAGRLVGPRELLTAMRGSPDHLDPSYLRTFVAQVRRKIEDDPGRPRHLLTEPGLGYRLLA